MEWPLFQRLPAKAQANASFILDQFLDYLSSRGLGLYPAQEEAILALFDGKNVILNTPTGSGKSLVALALQFLSLSQGRRSFFTCPIKALVNEKFRDLCAAFGPEQVGMITGDGSVNSKAPIICCTAEILAQIALREGNAASLDDIIMDEFHYYSDKQRGVAWQIPLLTLSGSRFLLMSATLGEMDFFSKVLTDLNKIPTEIVRSTDRPVPLDFQYSENQLNETIADLVSKGLAPIYLVNFSQREAAEEAQNLMSSDFSSKEEKRKILEALDGTKFQSPYGKDLSRMLKHGIGLHHAGLLPRYRGLVEKLAQQGLLKVISGTDTLGVGVNVPIRTVLFTKLSKYDGEKSGVLTVREFQQIAGRAGRRGFDTRGLVVAQAPEHVIENLKQKARTEGGKKEKKLKAPPPGFIMWTKETFQKLVDASPEPLVSRFSVSHGMLLGVLSRPDGISALKDLIRRSHGPAAGKRKLRRSAFELFRALLDRKIVEYYFDPHFRGVQIRITADLQEDFSLNQTLSLYLVDTISLLDPKTENYAFDVLTLVESILESPDLILRKQLDRIKSEKMNELKASGMPFEERIEELEKLEHPKPNAEFIYSTFNKFREEHPWIGEENIRPKSIAREMYENFQSFSDYVRDYELQRAEGVLLRYLSEVYRALEQNIPEIFKDEELRTMALYFERMVKDVDSSLLEDWEKLRANGPGPGQNFEQPSEAVPKWTEKEMQRWLRNEVFRFVKAFSRGNFEELALLASFEGQNREDFLKSLGKKFEEYHRDHKKICTDPKARSPVMLTIEKRPELWRLVQILSDPEEKNDWSVVFYFDPHRESLDGGLVFKSLGPIENHADL